MRATIMSFLMVMFLLNGCGSEKTSEPTQVSVVGTWSLSSLIVNGVQQDPDNYSDVPVKLTFNSGGSGYAWLEDYGAPDSAESGPLTWQTNGSQMTIQIQGDDAVTVTYTVSATSLTLTFVNGSKLAYSMM